jgi:hypothetical protein
MAAWNTWNGIKCHHMTEQISRMPINIILYYIPVACQGIFIAAFVLLIEAGCCTSNAENILNTVDCGLFTITIFISLVPGNQQEYLF